MTSGALRQDNWLFSNESESACKWGGCGGGDAALFCVTTLALSWLSMARMLISQRPFRRIRTGISGTYKRFQILASDVYTFLNGATGVT